MGYGAGKVTTPVGFADISNTMGSNSLDIGSLCTYGNDLYGVNKWSLWKPYRCAGLASPTNLQVAQMKFGIDVSTARHTGLENAIKLIDNTQPSPDKVTAGSTAYQYLRPTGGDASPYRTTDFADFTDSSAPAGLQFNRQYDDNACAPDTWHDWEMSQSSLESYADVLTSKITLANDDNNDETTWTVNSQSGIVYQFCSIRIGPQSQETIGNTPPNAMPLTLLFGNDTITKEKWRLALAVYLPYGQNSTNSKAQWMVFAGLKPLSVANGGKCLPSTLSNIDLCKALLYNVTSKNVTEFTFIPCILCNSTITGHVVSTDSTRYTTRVTLVDTFSPRLLLAPTFDRRKLIVHKTPKTGEVLHYSDSTYRGLYATNLVAGTYAIAKGSVTSSGSGYSVSFDYYRVTIPSGTTIKIEYAASGYSNNGNLKVTASGSNVSYYKYADEAAYKSNTVSGSALSATPANAAKFFQTYIGAATPNSVTPYLMVSKI